MKILVFGAFDGLHEGHRHFLRKARALGDYLVVALASDSGIRFLKGHDPQLTFSERASALSQNENVDEVVAGDELDDDGHDSFGSWKIIEKIKPDVIACGYDQQAIQKLLENHFTTLSSLQILTLEAFQPTIYKSSLLNTNL